MGIIAEQFLKEYYEAVQTNGYKPEAALADAVERAIERAQFGRHYHHTIPEGYELEQVGDAVQIKPIVILGEISVDRSVNVDARNMPARDRSNHG